VIGVVRAVLLGRRVASREEAGLEPILERYDPTPPPKAPLMHVEWFAGRIGYESPRGRAQSVPMMNIDGVALSDQGLTWGITTPGATNANHGTLWPWDEIDGAAVLAAHGQVQFVRGDERVTYKGRTEPTLGLVRRLRAELGDRLSDA
jgi:hypothetical protein